MTTHALAFGDHQTWGLAWLPADSSSAQLALCSGSASALIGVTLGAESVDGAWSLEGDGCSLQWIPSAAGRGRDAGSSLSAQDQLCQVSGCIRSESVETELQCRGWRTTVDGDPDLSSLGSFRLLAGWLDPATGFSLLALRPRRARGHDTDAVAAVVIEDPSPAGVVVDPRLSTTYTESGLPRRAGLELWLEAEGNEDDEGSTQYPRRAAGEVVAPGVDWKQDDFELHASLLRWHSHGHEGPGVYLLGQRQ